MTHIEHVCQKVSIYTMINDRQNTVNLTRQWHETFVTSNKTKHSLFISIYFQGRPVDIGKNTNFIKEPEFVYKLVMSY